MKENHLLKTTLFIFILLTLFNFGQPKISLYNVKKFFSLTYDQNGDDEVTWKEFCDYFKLIEPDHNFAFDVLNSAFNAFDVNGNGKIKLEEFIDMSEMEIKYKPGHKQIHLGFTENENEMQVMWVSNPEEY